MKYIDSEKLVAEIDRLGDVLNDPICQRDALGPDWVNGGKKMLKEIRSCIESLQQEHPSLPSNIDEAAEKYSENILANNEDLQDAIEDAFKEGAKWMARQGVTLNLSIDELSCGAYNSCVEQGLTSEDDVIIQVRKKQQPCVPQSITRSGAGLRPAKIARFITQKRRKQNENQVTNKIPLDGFGAL